MKIVDINNKLYIVSETKYIKKLKLFVKNILIV